MNESQSTVLQQSYFHKRMAELGVTEENNQIEIWQTEVMEGENQGKTVLKPMPIFRESPKGIDIFVYSLDQRKIKYTKEGSRFKNDYCITRLEHPRVTEKGIQKYNKPKGEPSYPFFPPKLVAKYGEKKPVKVLYVTEGFFKSWYADLNGIDCIGVQSITCLRDTSTNELWSDVKKLVQECKVERIIWLTDGDFNNLTGNELKDGIDLSSRPNLFYSTVHTFSEITSQLTDVERYFAHINSEELDGHPKGLDDMLLAFPEELPAMVMELNNFSILAPGKKYPGKYITRINISINTGRVRQYFHLDDVTKFYLHHIERRPELKTLKNFNFYGTTYKYDDEEGKCVVEVPGSASDYIRIGNDYYKQINMPISKNVDGTDKVKKVLSGRAKGTIVDDHGKDFCKHIRKYDAPCIVPDHFNYQQVVNNCYNLYHPFTYEPEEGDCSNTIDFFKHIFGTDLVTYHNPHTGQTTQFPRYELGIDYITIAYKMPWQMLPILCLVSNERQTGKTTMLNYLDELFQENAISIGNEDLEADFNAHWAGKVFIMVDETKVDNGRVINKIKRLSTARELIMNAKGKDQVKLPFFAKFLLTSNHVEDFVKIDKEEIRFWIHRVKTIAKFNPKYLQILIDEIPCFLHYINSRKMVTVSEERHWFKTSLLHTEALDLVKKNSVTYVEKRIATEVQAMFDLAPDMNEIGIPLKEIAAMIKVPDLDYVKKTLQNMGLRTFKGIYKYPKKKDTYVGVPGTTPELETTYEITKNKTTTTYYKFERTKHAESIETIPDSDCTAPVADTKTIDDMPF